MTALPDILDKFVVLLDEMQMPHIDVRCPVLRTLRNLSYQGHDARMKIATEPSMLARVGRNGRCFTLAELCLAESAEPGLRVLDRCLAYWSMRQSSLRRAVCTSRSSSATRRSSCSKTSRRSRSACRCSNLSRTGCSCWRALTSATRILRRRSSICCGADDFAMLFSCQRAVAVANPRICFIGMPSAQPPRGRARRAGQAATF